MSGDAPTAASASTDPAATGPRERGCSVTSGPSVSPITRLARVSGDAPSKLDEVQAAVKTGPRERGCSDPEARVGSMALDWPA